MDQGKLSICNPNPQRLPGPQLLHDLVTPPNDATAIDYLSDNEQTAYSYKELHDASDGLSQLIESLIIESRDVAEDIVIPVLIPQSPQLYISLLAVLKAGGAFCPLNADAPPDRVKFILEDVSAKVVLVTQELAHRIPSGCNVKVIRVDTQSMKPDIRQRPVRALDSERLAYVMYTSGSTGTPKGVGLTHGAATQALLAHNRHIPEFTRFLQFAAPTFDVSVFEIFFPLLRGNTLISINREEMLNDLPAAMRRMDVDACELTPTVAGSLLKKRGAVPKLRLLLTIGEMLQVPVIQEFGGNNDCESLLWAMYGPTEATIHCTLQTCLPSESSPRNIGIPLDTVSCFVIKPAESADEVQSFSLLCRGEAGELAVGGFQLARGYINRPEQTSTAFIDSPYGRVYRTGDRAVMKPDGTLECLGRLSDGQVKLRGQRVELGEIEHAALRTNGCHGASAAVIDSQLVLFCSVDKDVGEDAIELSCRSWLPQYMIPNELVVMKEFPRLPSGKVNAKKLKHDFSQQKATKNMTVDALNEPTGQERTILNIVSETLQESVNGGTVLMSAGLDSLSAIKLAAAFRQADFEISAIQLLKLRTVADLCLYLQRPAEKSAQLDVTHAPVFDLRSISEQHPLLANNSRLIENHMGCTPLQSAMLAQTEQTPGLNCNEMLFEASINATPQALFEAFGKVIQSNELLRTGFLHREGQYLSVLFSEPLNGQVTLRSEHQQDFSSQPCVDLLRPFRVQIIDRGKGVAPNVLIQAHHANYDGWSMDMIVSDISCIIEGKSPATRPQFERVVHFQNRATNESEDASSRAFWSSNLLGWNKFPFPKLVARAQSDEILSKEALLEISPEIIQLMSKTYGLSNQVIFQAALGMAWQGVTANSDILIGSVVSGRTIPVDGIERIIGPCIAALPLRIDTRSMSANIDVLKTIQAQNRAIMEHCNLPLADIRKLAGLKPSESLYDVLFVYQQSLYESEMKKGAIKQIKHIDRLDTKLLVEVEPTKAGYVLQMTYHSSVLSEDFVNLLAGQMQDLCKSIITEPTGPLTTLKNLQCLELSVHREEKRVEDEPMDVAALFNASLVRNPHAEAIRFISTTAEGGLEESILSYAQLSSAANQTAHYVRKSGAEVGDVVAIMMNKSATLYTAILGVINAGCAYLPILPTTPVERVCEILRQSETKFCLVDDNVDCVGDFPDTSLVLSINDASLRTLSTDALFVQPDPDRLAYVIFTSGTTGLPKGVAVSQRNLASNIAYLDSVYPKTAIHPRLLQACSHAFDVSVFEIFYAWYSGMSLCAAENDIIFGDLEQRIRELQITHLSLTPTVASLIDPKNVPEVEFLVTAGEPMTMPLLEKWDSLLFQGYGPSETTNICSVKRMSKGDNIEHLGWVFPNTSVFVLAPDGLDAVPRGWVGEFCFGGSQVANGYLNDRVMTDEKFIEHGTFGRIYRSGDMGRMLPDGSLIILGRLDDQLKLRGQRIEAQEINNILTSTALVTTAVTLLVQIRSGLSNLLATFFKPLDAAHSQKPLAITKKTNKVLFATLQSKLPAYMVPSYLIPVSYVPMTPSGKVDRPHLLSWFESLSSGYLEEASPLLDQFDAIDSWTDMESRVARAVSESMHVPQNEIGRWTPFPTLGVDSISAIGLSRSLRTHLQVHVPISAIVQNPSVAQLGQFLTRVDSHGPSELPSKMKASFETFEREVGSSFGEKMREVDAILPCMPLQEAMLLQGQGRYYNKILLRLQVSPSDMQSYWRQMSKRHSILRTCFVTTANATYPIAQVVLRNWHLPWKLFEVTVPSLAGASREHLDSLPEPLDSMIPPCSLGLIRYRGLNFLSFICHHALYDGIAMENLWREVEAIAQGRQLQDAALYLPFLHKALDLPVDVKSFWKEQFRGFQPSVAFARSAQSSVNQCTNTLSIDMSLKDIQQRVRSFGLSLLSLCQAAWATVLACVFDDPDVAFGNVVSGRTLNVDGIHKLVAPCFNTIPLRLDTSRSAQSIDLVKACQDLNLKLLMYQFTPLKLVRKVVGGRRRRLFDTLFLLQQPLKEMDKSIWTLEEDTGNMDVPIVCEVVPCPNLNSIVVNLHYDMDMITSDLALTITDMFRFMIRSMITLPFGPVPSRLTIPTAFSQGLLGLALKRETCENFGQTEMMNSQWSSLEEKIRQVIADISRTSDAQIRRETTIFQVGLDSINAVQVASALRSQGLSVSSFDVIECPSCSKLASRINQNLEKLNHENVRMDFSTFQDQVSEDVRNKLGSNTEIEAILPCTPVQNAMLVAFVLPGKEYYLNSMSFRLQNPVDTASLLVAWKLLRDRHPMLRTGFVPVAHTASTFAMVRRKSTELTDPVMLFDGAEFVMEDWTAESRLLILRNLHEPPWKVALVNKGSQKFMHVIIHHALYDAQSLDGLLQALSNLVQGKPCNFSSIEPALADVLSKGKSGMSEAQKFWESQAAGVVINKFPCVTSLREPSGKVAVRANASSMSFRELREATQAMGISVQAALQASWARLLASYLGERSVVFGIALAGRTSDVTANAPFPCLVTVPVVAEVEESNMTLLQNMMEYNSGLYKHQFKSLAQVQKWLGHPATPIFDTMLVYQKTGGSYLNTEQWKLMADNPSVEYAVSLEVEPLENDEVCLRITAMTDIVPHGQMELILKQFDGLLNHLLRWPNATQGELYRSQKDLFSITPVRIPLMDAPVEFVHEFVERNAELQPEFPALEFVSDFNGTPTSRRVWTYKQLDELGNRVAHMLSQVVHVGNIVAIHFPKCPEAYFTILGILKAGCSFVALDPDSPKTRKEFILDDCQAVCLLTNRGIIDLLFEVKIPVIDIDEASLRLCPPSRIVHKEVLTTDNTCYCLYTSGTTGNPKGCEITHENTVQAMMAFQRLFQGHWQKTSRWLQFASLHFDVSVLEQYWSWSVGITVVAAPKDLILDDLTGTIHKMEITHIDLTPSLARLTHPNLLPNICKGVFITGGEQLNQEILDSWGSRAVIYNAYGPTEATIGVTMYPRVPVNGRPSNIGQQFPNVGSYVFQQGTEIPVLRGGVGELCVAGRLVGKGYLHRPQLTSERFPVLLEFNEKVYRTGDLVRILHDGCFDFLGRADDQVKLRGQRLEIGEINHIIRNNTLGVKDAAALVMQHGKKDVLVAFLVGDSERTSDLCIVPDEDALGAKARLSCLDSLPGYMIPTYFIRLSHIPLSPNNKVEAKRLKKMFENIAPDELMKLTGRDTTSSNSRVGAAVMRDLAQTLAEFSGLPASSISASTSIFDIGVDSISSMRLSAMLKGRGFPMCTPATILRSPIVSDLAQSISHPVVPSEAQDEVKDVKQALRAYQHRYRALVCRELGVKSTDIEYIAPCSSLQEGMISASVSDSGSYSYFNCFDLHIKHDTPMDVVRHVWETTIRDHSILRSVFVRSTDGYLQVALHEITDVWQYLVASDDSDVEVILERTRLSWTAANASQILSPLRFIQVDGPGKRALRLCIFHGLYDGNSFDLMNEHACCVYLSKKPPSRPDFFDVLPHGPLRNFEFCKPFWTEHLKHWQHCELPKVLPRTTKLADIVSLSRRLPIERVEDLRQQQNVTLQTVVLSIWTMVLQMYVSQPLTTGIIVAGRSLDVPCVENTVGPLFNTIPFFNKTLQGLSWETLVQKCHKFNTDILSFPHVPLRDIQKWCSGGQSLFNNLFAFQLEKSESYVDALPWTTIDNEATSVDYPLAFEATRTRDGHLSLHLVAHPDIANEDTLKDLFDHFEQVLTTVQAGTAVAPSPEIDLSCATDFRPRLSSPDSIAVPEKLQWTPTSLKIRDELCAFANIPIEDACPGISVLELGIDSIDAIKISARLAKRHIKVSASQIMRRQTISAIAGTASTLNPDDSVEDSIHQARDEIQHRLQSYVQSQGLDMNNIEVVLPSTALQESMIAGMIQSGFQWYFNHDIMKLERAISLTKLRDAWSKVIESSPILRTAFYEVDNGDLDMTYCQVVHKQHTAPIVIRELPDAFSLQSLVKTATETAIRGEARNSLIQVFLATSLGQNYMILSIAHALYDGWSLALLYDDLARAYQSELKPRKYSEILMSQTLLYRSSDDDGFWETYLANATPTLFKSGTSSTPSAFSSIIRSEHLSSPSLAEINSFCKKTSISLQSLCMACWAAVTGHFTQSLDTVFGVVLSGRDFEGADELVFPCMNTVAVRSILHANVHSFLKYMEANLADLRDHQEFPLRKAQAAAKLGGKELFNSLFIVQKSPNSDSSSAMWRSIGGTSAVEYPVCVEAEPEQGQLRWRMACRPDMFSRQGLEDVLQKLDHVLSFFLGSPQSETLSFRDGLVSICALPQTVIEEQQLDSQEDAAPHNDNDDAHYWNETAVSIRQVLSEVSSLPTESILLTSSLYHLGLDSISAIKVSLMLRKMHIDLKPRDLIRATSIRQIVQLAEQELEPQEEESVSLGQWKLPASVCQDNIFQQHNILERDIEAAIPATSLQIYMISAWQNSNASVFYPEFCYEMAGEHTREQLVTAWHRVWKQVPILRVRFVSTGDAQLPWIQVIVKADSISRGRISPPLWHLSISNDGGQSSWLLRLSIHHSLYDGFSLGKLMQLYYEELHHTTDSIANPGITLTNWQNYAIRPTLPARISSRKQFWTDYLAGYSQKAEYLIPYSTERVSHLRKQALPNTKKLRHMASSHGISLQSLFFAAYAKTVYDNTEAQDTASVVFGVYLANRDTDTDNLDATYPTMNLVPLRVPIAPESSLPSIAAAILHDLQRIQSNDRELVGLWEIYNWTGVQIRTFVNFLSLPDDDADTKNPGLVRNTSKDSMSMSGPDRLQEPWLQNNIVREAYPVSPPISYCADTRARVN
ncbi:nrps [Metarhizium rileyi]|uniref:Nonribosomal peptide synthetase sidN n=1 Tax=Metarhizium rileyi (strain RCEF 4871) TaxID=1649241 RepID=A0A5C6GBJ8_METRR|nr:nrps [Metarhizium rileyi]